MTEKRRKTTKRDKQRARTKGKQKPRQRSTGRRPKPLDDIDQAMLQFILGSPGITDEQLGAQVGLSRQRTNRRRNNPTFTQRLLEIRQQTQQDAISLILKHQSLAVQVVVRQLALGYDPANPKAHATAPLEAVKQRAAFWVARDLNKEASKRATPKHDDDEGAELSREQLEGLAGLAAEVAKTKAADG